MLDECLDARDEDPRRAAPPRRQRGDAGRRLICDELAALVGKRCPRLQNGNGGGIAQPRDELLRDAVADLGVAGNPGQPLVGRAVDPSRGERRGEVGLGAVRDRAQPDVSTNRPSASAWPGRRPADGQSFAEGRERTGRRQERQESRQVWLAASGAAPRGASHAFAEPPLTAPLPAEDGRPGGHVSSLRRRIFRHPVRVRRTPDSSGGPSTAPGGATSVSSAGRSSNMLNRFAAFEVPCRAHSSTA